MTKGRMEAFSDGVIAVLITIMVLELKAPLGSDLAALVPLWHTFLAYVLSFLFLAIYWNNHHHLLQAAHHVSGRTMWANLHLLFWLSLVPFVTSWLGENDFAAVPMAFYGLVMLMSGFAFFLLVRALAAAQDADSALVTAIGNDIKGRISLVVYAVAMPVALLSPTLSFVTYVAVAVMWVVPDRRFERAVVHRDHD